MPVSNTLDMVKRGLTAAQIKWIALILMTVDHLGAFGFEIPVIGRYYTRLRAVGRLAMPLFLFLLVQSIRHTRSKPRFLLRLYVAGMCTELFVAATNFFLGDLFGVHSPGNILFSFFYAALYILLIEACASALRARRFAAALLPVLAGAAVTLLPAAVCEGIEGLFSGETGIRYMILRHDLLRAFLPSVWGGDYGWGLAALGAALYFARTKRRQCAVFGGFCLLCAAGAVLLPADLGPITYTYIGSFINTFCTLSQCRMVLALPLMMLYNGRRGRGPKWLFYIYYPTHRYVISIVSHLLCTV